MNVQQLLVFARALTPPPLYIFFYNVECSSISVRAVKTMDDGWQMEEEREDDDEEWALRWIYFLLLPLFAYTRGRNSCQRMSLYANDMRSLWQQQQRVEVWIRDADLNQFESWMERRLARKESRNPRDNFKLNLSWKLSDKGRDGFNVNRWNEDFAFFSVKYRHLHNPCEMSEEFESKILLALKKSVRLKPQNIVRDWMKYKVAFQFSFVSLRLYYQLKISFCQNSIVADETVVAQVQSDLSVNLIYARSIPASRRFSRVFWKWRENMIDLRLGLWL